MRWKLKVQKSHWKTTSQYRLRWSESADSSRNDFPHFRQRWFTGFEFSVDSLTGFEVIKCGKNACIVPGT
jgi:hypothetical protein